MDVNVYETANEFADQTEEFTFPLPASDYDKKGRLKSLRGRMLKKLLKYEFRALLPPLYLCLGLLAAISVLACVLFNLPQYDETTGTVTLLVSILYIYALFATPIVPLIVALGRYHKHFFKDEGYLTFSIPASMEEHIFAKHVSGMAATFVGLAATVISAIVVYNAVPFMDFFEGTIIFVPTRTLSPLTIVEDALISLEWFVGIFCVGGALTCLWQGFRKKWHAVVFGIGAYLLFMIIEVLAVSFGSDLFFFFNRDPVGMHVSAWLSIVLYAAIIVLCVWFELRTLKYKLNLK